MDALNSGESCFLAVEEPIIEKSSKHQSEKRKQYRTASETPQTSFSVDGHEIQVMYIIFLKLINFVN